MRVATFHHNSVVLQNAMATQARSADVVEQQSSGLKSRDFAGLGADGAKFANLEVSLMRAEARVNLAREALTRTETTHSKLGKANDLLTKIRASVNGVKTQEQLKNLQDEAAASLKDLAMLMNARFAGRYLFSGSLTQSPPVDLENYKATDLKAVNTGYYKGDSYIQEVRVAPGRSIGYGLTGDRPGFEKSLRALSFAATQDPLKMESVKELSDLLVSAQDALIGDQSINGTAASRLKAYIESESSFADEVGKLAIELTGVNVAEAAAKAASFKVQLQASFMAIRSLTSLNLVDYLR